MIKDFNSIFWETWGVNQRVYTYEDVFRIKNSFTESFKKMLYKFKNNIKMKEESFFEILYNEPNQFYLLFNNLFYKVENDESIKLIKELNNIAFTFRFLDMFNIDDQNKKVKMFAFQIAYIIEKIKKLDIDISIFEKALEENSFRPYINYYAKKSKKNQNGIAQDLHDTFDKLMDNISNNYNTSIKYIDSQKVFINDLSKWKNGELPEFLKILVINATIYLNAKKPEQRAQLILMLILRALLHIKKEYINDKKIKDQFLEELHKYKEIIQHKLNEDDQIELKNLKLAHCIDFERMLSESEGQSTIDLKDLLKYMIPFCEDIKDFELEEDLQNKLIAFASKKFKSGTIRMN